MDSGLEFKTITPLLHCSINPSSCGMALFRFHVGRPAALRGLSSDFVQFVLEPLAARGGGDILEHHGDVTVHEFREIMPREAEAMISYPILGEIIGSDTFAAAAGAHLCLAFGGVFFLFLALLSLQQPAAEKQQGELPVPVLRLFLPALALGKLR